MTPPKQDTEAISSISGTPTLNYDPASENIPPDQSLGLKQLIALAFIASTSPLAVDLYLASFPEIQQDLGTSASMVQLTLTAYLVGIAIGQPIWGPLSDRFGRRIPLLVSNSVTVLSSVVVMLAPTIELLIGARFIQALSAASGMVLARAMIADSTRGYGSIRAMSLMMTIVGVTPVLAPALGGLLAAFLPWRAVLGVFLAIVVLQLVVTVFAIGETLPTNRRSKQLSYGDLIRVLARPPFLVYGLTVGLGVASMMAYVASASFVYQEVLGFSTIVFGASFAINALGMSAAGLLSARLARRRIHPTRTVRFALPGVIASSLFVTVAAASAWPTLLVIPIFCNAFFLNLVMSNCMGLAMEHSKGLPGAGSAALGFLMFGLGALVTGLAGLIGDVSSAVPMGVTMTSVAVLAALVFVGGQRWIRHRELTHENDLN